MNSVQPGGVFSLAGWTFGLKQCGISSLASCFDQNEQKHLRLLEGFWHIVVPLEFKKGSQTVGNFSGESLNFLKLL